MIMELDITFPNNLSTAEMLKVRRIPCLCSIDGEDFNIAFQPPLPDVSGKVCGWTPSIISERAPAGVGGQYTYFCFGMVSLVQKQETMYRIVDLYFFDRNYGWCGIVENGTLSVSHNFYDKNSVETTIDSWFPAKEK
jgi:hypothetical protein